mmetsp:Transcript_22458/g.46795  ORF Transcript_22458/g.46795 Transcript_22458/m.46795 type:complete len:217 (-) Transcript_22458:241-891(-)
MNIDPMVPWTTTDHCTTFKTQIPPLIGYSLFIMKLFGMILDFYRELLSNPRLHQFLLGLCEHHHMLPRLDRRSKRCNLGAAIRTLHLITEECRLRPMHVLPRTIREIFIPIHLNQCRSSNFTRNSKQRINSSSSIHMISNNLSLRNRLRAIRLLWMMEKLPVQSIEKVKLSSSWQNSTNQCEQGSGSVFPPIQPSMSYWGSTVSLQTRWEQATLLL